MNPLAVDHPYHCELQCYFSADNYGAEYEDWASFLDAEGDNDDDMNLLFRWDWYDPTQDEYADEQDKEHITLFFFLQRKGFHRAVEVLVTEADCEVVQSYLEGKWAHLQRLWAPIPS